MKTYIALSIALAGFASAANLEWKGGTTTWFEEASNWKHAGTNTQATQKPGDGDTVTIGETGEIDENTPVEGKFVEIGNNGGTHTFDNLTLTVGVNSTLQIDSNRSYSFNNSNITLKKGAKFITSETTVAPGATNPFTASHTTFTIEEGAQLDMRNSKDSAVGYDNTTFNVKGANGVALGNTWCDRDGKKHYTFNLFENGSVTVNHMNNVTNSNLRLTLTGSVNTGAAAGASGIDASDIVLIERTLITFNDFNTQSVDPETGLTNLFSNCAFTSQDGTPLTLDASLASMEEFTFDDLGKYNLIYRAGESYTVTENGSAVTYNPGRVILQYTALIPEPTTATLSLLALAGLAARRRRR